MSDFDPRVEALAALSVPSIPQAFVRSDDTSPTGDRKVQEAQVYALLDIADAIRGLREDLGRCAHGNVGICMSCVQDGMMGLR